MFDFSNKVVLVTGAGRGIGEEICKRFLSNGATVIASDIVQPQWQYDSHQEKLKSIALDVSNEEMVIKTISELNSSSNGISILVNCAGISIESDLMNSSLKDWQKQFDVNSTGTFLCTREVVKHMIDNSLKGSIVNISSIAGRNAFPGASGYCASKAAVIGFTRSISIELGSHDINVNAVCPGSVYTPMLQGVIAKIASKTGIDTESIQKSMEDSIPMKRFQTPEDIANLVMFLSSELARNINGETINLDGGVVRN